MRIRLLAAAFLVLSLARPPAPYAETPPQDQAPAPTPEQCTELQQNPAPADRADAKGTASRDACDKLNGGAPRAAAISPTTERVEAERQARAATAVRGNLVNPWLPTASAGSVGGGNTAQTAAAGYVPGAGLTGLGTTFVRPLDKSGLVPNPSPEPKYNPFADKTIWEPAAFGPSARALIANTGAEVFTAIGNTTPVAYPMAKDMAAYLGQSERLQNFLAANFSSRPDVAKAVAKTPIAPKTPQLRGQPQPAVATGSPEMDHMGTIANTSPPPPCPGCPTTKAPMARDAGPTTTGTPGKFQQHFSGTIALSDTMKLHADDFVSGTAKQRSHIGGGVTLIGIGPFNELFLGAGRSQDPVTTYGDVTTVDSKGHSHTKFTKTVTPTQNFEVRGGVVIRGNFVNEFLGQ